MMAGFGLFASERWFSFNNVAWCDEGWAGEKKFMRGVIRRKGAIMKMMLAAAAYAWGGMNAQRLLNRVIDIILTFFFPS